MEEHDRNLLQGVLWGEEEEEEEVKNHCSNIKT